MSYRLSRKRKDDEAAPWLSSTKGDLEYVMTVLKLNLETPELHPFEYKVTYEEDES